MKNLGTIKFSSTNSKYIRKSFDKIVVYVMRNLWYSKEKRYYMISFLDTIDNQVRKSIEAEKFIMVANFLIVIVKKCK